MKKSDQKNIFYKRKSDGNRQTTKTFFLKQKKKKEYQKNFFKLLYKYNSCRMIKKFQLLEQTSKWKDEKQG